MSNGKDPERLLAEALRAQAAQARPSAPAPPLAPAEPVEGENPSLGGYNYGLLSGSDLGRRLRAQAALTHAYQPREAVPQPQTPAKPATARIEQTRLAVGWILLLALLFGLAAGSVVALLTLL